MHSPAIARGIALIASLSSVALAQHAGDILLELDYRGRLSTGRVEEDTGAVVHNQRVFVGVFDEFNFTNEPGMDSEVGAFAPGTTIGFRIRRALRAWDGSAFVAIPPERVRVVLGNLGPVFTPSDDHVVNGFGMLVASSGEFHHHPGYTLTDPADDGIYALELELWSTQQGASDSKPYWLVLGKGADVVDLESAAAWVEAELVGCASDFDGSGFTDTDDFDAFVFAYEAGDFTADADGSGFVDTDDFDAFVRSFEGGC